MATPGAPAQERATLAEDVDVTARPAMAEQGDPETGPPGASEPGRPPASVCVPPPASIWEPPLPASFAFASGPFDEHPGTERSRAAIVRLQIRRRTMGSLLLVTAGWA